MEYIFSYGSNLLFDRIRQRIKSVEVVGCYELQHYALVFNKKSRDNSSKANVCLRKDDLVHGVIHRISADDKKILDEYEGLGNGYEMEYFSMVLQGERIRVGFYMVKDQSYLCDDQPYDWYHQCVLYGAMENELNTAHIERIWKTTYKKDPDTKRNRTYRELLQKHRKRYANFRI